MYQIANRPKHLYDTFMKLFARHERKEGDRRRECAKKGLEYSYTNIPQTLCKELQGLDNARRKSLLLICLSGNDKYTIKEVTRMAKRYKLMAKVAEAALHVSQHPFVFL